MIKSIEFYIGGRQIGKTGEAIGMFSLLSNQTPNTYLCGINMDMCRRLETRIPVFWQKKCPVYTIDEFVRDVPHLTKGVKRVDEINLVIDEFLFAHFKDQKNLYECLERSGHLFRIYVFTTSDQLYKKSILNWAEFTHSQNRVPSSDATEEQIKHFYSLLSHPKTDIKSLSSNQTLYVREYWVEQLLRQSGNNYKGITQNLLENFGACVVVDT
jgi:hypothetical protein